MAEKRADALCRMAETALANKECESKTAEQYQVLLHVSAETSQRDGEQRCELDNDPMTCVPHMTDSTMDYGMAVDGLLQRRNQGARLAAIQG